MYKKYYFCSKKKQKTIVSALAKEGKTMTITSEMTECLNNFLTSIDKNLQKQIPPTKKHFKDYLKNPNKRKFFVHSHYYTWGGIRYYKNIKKPLKCWPF